MTNAEKYKTAKERAEAFRKYHDEHHHKCCDVPYAGDAINRCVMCIFKWLELEAPSEEPLPCPFCGEKCSVHILGSGNPTVLCDNDDCFYHASLANTREEAISAHNRVARAAKEVNDANA